MDNAEAYLELGIGKHESGGVYICKDNYLMDKFTSYSQKQLAANAEALAELQKKLAEKGISVSTMLVPVAAQVLSDKLPAYAPVADYAAILKVLSDAGVNVTDIMSILAAHSDEAIYYRTDHHWTSLGTCYAYCTWRGIEPAADEWTKEALCNNFRGTTWNKVPLPSDPAEEITAWYKHANRRVSYNNGEYETDSIYERKYLNGSDQYAAFLNSNQAQTVIQGSGKEGKLLRFNPSCLRVENEALRPYSSAVSARASSATFSLSLTYSMPNPPRPSVTAAAVCVRPHNMLSLSSRLCVFMPTNSSFTVDEKDISFLPFPLCAPVCPPPLCPHRGV